MGTLVKRNKQEKEKNLYQAAYILFAEKGIESTTVDQIVKKAGIAKGTFYLYFKDKYDLIDKLILKESYALAKEALEKTRDRNVEVFEESILYFTDYVIGYFKKNVLMLKIINKDFSNGLYKNSLDLDGMLEVKEILEVFITKLKERGYTEEDSRLTLYMIIELVGSVCYNAIVLNRPCSIEKIKPVLFKKIIAMVN